jgi:hypothetical protein
VGVLSHAQSCSPHPQPDASGWSRARGRRSASALHQFHQCPRTLDRPPLPEPVCFDCYGRIASAGGISYVSLNPVRAGLAGNAADWAWSSVRAHLAGKDDGLVTVRPVLDRVSSLADLVLDDRDEASAALRRAEGTGRPVNTAEFVIGLERVLGRRIARRAPGPAPAASVSAKQLKLLQ